LINCYLSPLKTIQNSLITGLLPKISNLQVLIKKTKVEDSNRLSKYLGYLQIFVGMGALAGGFPMIMDPNGASQGLSTVILMNSPFKDFLIPGIVLFGVNGIGSLIGSYFSLKYKDRAAYIGAILGIFLVLWIVIQMYFLGYSTWLQPLYLVMGITEFVLSFFLYKNIQASE
jgi:hypothetical protein